MFISDTVLIGTGLVAMAVCWSYRYKVINPTWWRMERSKIQEWRDCFIMLSFWWPVPYAIAVLASLALR